jgi:hypothetical protein
MFIKFTRDGKCKHTCVIAFICTTILHNEVCDFRSSHSGMLEDYVHLVYIMLHHRVIGCAVKFTEPFLDLVRICDVGSKSTICKEK